MLLGQNSEERLLINQTDRQNAYLFDLYIKYIFGSRLIASGHVQQEMLNIIGNHWKG